MLSSCFSLLMRCILNLAFTGPQIPTGENASIKGRDNDGIQLKGKNTFAVPRNVRPLGFTANKPKADEEDEKPKSNDEFRNMLLKK